MNAIINEIKNPYPHLFSPLRVKNLIYRNRVVCTPMGTVPTHTILSSTDYGTVSAYDKALGGSAMMNMTYHGSQRTKTFELCGGNPFDKYEMDIIREQLSVHKAGGALCSFGIAFPWHYEGVLYTPSGRPFAGRKAEKITSDIIWKQLDMIEEKCRKVKEFGFDSLIADLSCDTMITQFLAPGFNDRDDEWGGSFENRARAGVEFIRRARKAVGPDFVIELRMSAELFMPGSYTFEELCKFVGMVKDEIDIMNIMVGMDEYHEASVKMCPMIFEPHMGNIKYAKKIRELYPDLLINLCTGIMTPEEGEYIIANNIADLVTYGRSLNADPYWPIKAQTGHADDIVPCIRCNQCYNAATRHFNTACSVNPRYRRENRVPLILPKTECPKQVVIIGGGPAGMKAALTAAEKGHHVMLLEAADKLGGQLNIADKGKYKGDLRRYHNYIEHQIEKSQVEVRLNVRATREYLKNLKPDVIIIAIGAEPKTLKYETDNSIKVYQVTDWLKENYELGEHIVVIGGGSVGCEEALTIADDAGKKVTIVEYGDILAPNGNDLYKAGLYQHLDAQENLTQLTNSRFIGVKDGCVEIERKGEKQKIPADTVLLSVGFQTDTDAVAEFFGIVPATHYVGDCKNVATIMEANNEAYFIASSIG